MVGCAGGCKPLDDSPSRGEFAGSFGCSTLAFDHLAPNRTFLIPDPDALEFEQVDAHGAHADLRHNDPHLYDRPVRFMRPSGSALDGTTCFAEPCAFYLGADAHEGADGTGVCHDPGNARVGQALEGLATDGFFYYGNNWPPTIQCRKFDEYPGSPWDYVNRVQIDPEHPRMTQFLRESQQSSINRDAAGGANLWHTGAFHDLMVFAAGRVLMPPYECPSGFGREEYIDGPDQMAAHTEYMEHVHYGCIGMCDQITVGVHEPLGLAGGRHESQIWAVALDRVFASPLPNLGYGDGDMSRLIHSVRRGVGSQESELGQFKKHWISWDAGPQADYPLVWRYDNCTTRKGEHVLAELLLVRADVRLRLVIQRLGIHYGANNYAYFVMPHAAVDVVAHLGLRLTTEADVRYGANMADWPTINGLPVHEGLVFRHASERFDTPPRRCHWEGVLNNSSSPSLADQDFVASRGSRAEVEGTINLAQAAKRGTHAINGFRVGAVPSHLDTYPGERRFGTGQLTFSFDGNGNWDACDPPGWM